MSKPAALTWPAAGAARVETVAEGRGWRGGLQ